MALVPDAGETPRAQLKERLAEHIDQAHRTETSGAPHRSGFYVFFSFDLVDATRFKEVEPRGWPLVISRFYDLITDSAEKHLQPIQRWKLVGDEVLLHKRIRSIRELSDCVRAAHKILTDAAQRIHREFPTTNPLVSVKGTVWCARVHHVAPQDILAAQEEFDTQGYRNIVVSQPGDPDAGGGEQLDFLGPDIDTGFRISKYVSRRRLVVSADLAYLLYRERAHDEGIEQTLQIVSYELLKGVWGGRRYPIVWFEPDWLTAADTFQYDERFGSEIVARIVNERGIEPLARLQGIYKDLNRGDEIGQLYDYVASLRPEEVDADGGATVTAVARPGVELHVAAVAFRRADGRVLLAKRPATKRRFGGKWEFGCGQLAPNESIERALVRAYQEDFGAKLEFPGGVRPVATYTIGEDGSGPIVPGLICVAEVTNANDVRALRHDEFQWVLPTPGRELPDPADCVPNLYDSLAAAHAVWNGLREGSHSCGMRDPT